MFNIVESKEFAIDADQLLVSGRVDVTDRFQRIKLKHQTHGQLIVKNDPIGHLFRTVQPQDIDAPKRSQIVMRDLGTFPLGARIGNAVDAAGANLT